MFMEKGKQLETKLIDFEGGQLLGFKTEEGKIYLGIKKTCLDIGLTERQAKVQIQELKENDVLSEGVQNFVLVQNEGGREVRREVTGIAEKFVTAWLFQIRLTPSFKTNNPEAYEKLKKYQSKAVDVLHEAFMGTEEKRQGFCEEMGLEGQIVELKSIINNLENKIETMDSTMGKTLSTLVNSATINSYQAKQLNVAVRTRISTMLGGAHSALYKRDGRMYFKNLWLNLCDKFGVSEYRDLNPLNYNDAVTYINNWSMSVRG